MKKIIILTFFITCYFSSLNAQVSLLGFNYQAQIRNASGVLIPDSTIQLKFTLLPNQFSTTPAWVETQSVKTDPYGIASAVIGKGTRTEGTYTSFDQVDFSSGNFFIRVEINSDGNFTKLGDDEPFQSVPYAKVAGNLTLFPAGFIMAFAGDTTKIPSGWLLCDGRAISRSQYADLYNAIQDNWGRGDLTSTFNLPDLRGQFLRGVTGASANDPDAATRLGFNGGNIGNNVGSIQTDAFANHRHPITNGGFVGPASSYVGGGYAPNVGPGAFTETVGGNETRPKNAYVNFLIKY